MQKIMLLLKRKLEIIIWTLVVFIIFGLVVYLGNQNTSYFWLAVQICSLLLMILLLINYFNLQKQEKLADQLNELERNYQALLSQFDDYKTENREYFMLLVHQIKTPITASNLLLNNQNVNSNALKKELHYIEDYVNMTIAYLKLIESNSDIDIYQLELDKVIGEVLKKYAIFFIEKKIKLDYQRTNAKVISDFRWLSLLLEQIIANALKYSKDEGKITIYYRENHLFIADDGIGIKKEDIQRIFDIGYSGYNGRLNQKSSGLGLYLAQKIAAKLNIEIAVESEIKVGSTFELTFL